VDRDHRVAFVVRPAQGEHKLEVAKRLPEGSEVSLDIGGHQLALCRVTLSRQRGEVEQVDESLLQVAPGGGGGFKAGGLLERALRTRLVIPERWISSFYAEAVELTFQFRQVKVAPARPVRAPATQRCAPSVRPCVHIRM